MKKFQVIVNFKNVMGELSYSIAKKLNEISLVYPMQYEIILALNKRDAKYLTNYISLPIILQNICSTEEYLLTFLDKEWILNSQVKGILINHPQKKIREEIIDREIKLANDMNLEIYLGASTLDEALKLNNQFGVSYIALENERFIGQNISFKNECQEFVHQSLNLIENKVLFGGGIKTTQDIDFVSEEGGDGVLIASIIINSIDPLDSLMRLLGRIGQLQKSN